MRVKDRKAAADPCLDLYALAQVRASKVKEEFGARCKECPGPTAEDGCRSRPAPKIFLQRTDWPMCPLGMLRQPAWQAHAELYQASQTSALERWPDRYLAVASYAQDEIRAAIDKEQERLIKAQRKDDGGSTAPHFSGQRTAR